MMRCNSVSVQPPALGVPERIWLFPKKQALWVAAGVLWLPILISIRSIFDPYAFMMFGNLFWLATWLVALVVGLLFAFVNPGGLHAGEWFMAWLRNAVQPKKAAYWRE